MEPRNKGTGHPAGATQRNGPNTRHEKEQPNPTAIVHELDTVCTVSVQIALYLAAWASTQRDASHARLATDALRLACDAHMLQHRLADAIAEAERAGGAPW
jgi:hypothetical protein